METILQEMNNAVAAGLFYMAILAALAVPDICAALESPSGRTSGEQYKAWCDQWLLPAYPLLTAADLWAMRCGVVHQGRSEHPNSQYSRVIFTAPTPNRMTFHNNTVGDALNLDISTFCWDVTQAAVAWLNAHQGDPAVQANWPRLMRFYPQGIGEWPFQGVPLVT